MIFVNFILFRFVHDFKYLGHVVTCTLIDDDDIMLEVRNLFIRTNILIGPQFFSGETTPTFLQQIVRFV